MKKKLITICACFAIVPILLVNFLYYYLNFKNINDSTYFIFSSTIIGIIFLILAFVVGNNLSNSIDGLKMEKKDIVCDKSLIKGEDKSKNIKLGSQEFEDLKSSTSTLKSTSSVVTTSANDVANSVQEISKDAETQANEIADVVTLIEGLKNEIDSVKQKLMIVAKNSETSREKANEGENKIYELIDFIVNIKSSFDAVMSRIDNLSQTVSEIGKITDVISGISEQTNLLALNASIEAARAGEHGKGFTVVADEVRKLAEESKASSEKVISLVSSIKSETDDIIKNSSQIGNVLEDQATAANDTIVSFEDIVSSIKSIPELINDTAEFMDKTLQDNNTVLEKVQNVSASSQNVSAASQEIAASSEELLTISEELSNLCSKINENTLKLDSSVVD
jgi:methyl-accepting chemotaxis protein